MNESSALRASSESLAGKALLAAAATGIQVGAATVTSRAIIEALGPASLAFLRYALAVLILLPFVLAQRRREGPARLGLRDGSMIVLLGVVQFGVLISLLNFSLKSIPAALGTLLFSTSPFLAMLLAAALGLERLSPAKTLGVMITIAGVALALYERLQLPSQAGVTLGVAAALGAALCGALCSVLYRPYLRRHATLPVSFVAMLGSVAFLALPAWWEGLPGRLPVLDAQVWAAVAFIGLSSGIGYALWLYALKHNTPTKVTVFLGLSPITAILLEAVFLGAGLSLYQSAGALAVLVGLMVASGVMVPMMMRSGQQ